jgi:hemerythrin superfamily protein
MATAVAQPAAATAPMASSPANLAPLDPFDADIVACIKRDHEAFRDVQRSIDAAAFLSPNERATCVADLVRLVVRHSMAEEVVLYPLARQCVGPDATDRELDDHKRLRAELSALSASWSGDPALDAKLARLWRTLSDHMAEEEGVLLPLLARHTTRERRVTAGRLFAAAHLAAPTRPHPLAPMGPPLNVLASALAGPLDWIADMWRFSCAPPL